MIANCTISILWQFLLLQNEQLLYLLLWFCKIWKKRKSRFARLLAQIYNLCLENNRLRLFMKDSNELLLTGIPSFLRSTNREAPIELLVIRNFHQRRPHELRPLDPQRLTSLTTRQRIHKLSGTINIVNSNGIFLRMSSTNLGLLSSLSLFNKKSSYDKTASDEWIRCRETVPKTKTITERLGWTGAGIEPTRSSTEIHWL